MLPLRNHHRCMAAILFFGGAALLMATLTNDWEYCQKKPDMKPVHPATALWDTILKNRMNFAALVIMALAAVPNHLYNAYPSYTSHYVSSRKCEYLVKIVAKYDASIVSSDVWNSLIYLFLLISGSIPYIGCKSMDWTAVGIAQHYFSYESPVRCVPGLSPLLWFQLVIPLIMISLLVMVVISSLNVYVATKAIKKQRKINPPGYICFIMDYLF